MRDVRQLRSRRRGGLWWSPFVVVVLGPVVVWLLVRQRDWATGEVAVAVSAATAVSVAVAGLVERRLDKRDAERDAPPVPHGLSSERLEEWRLRLREAVLEARAEQGGQLDQMVRYGEAIDMNFRRVEKDSARPRLRVRGRLLSWSEIKREWDNSEGRLVILGDPGYGKTVAALTLVAHINGRDVPDGSVAELFSLADWYRWQAEHPGAGFSEWLAEQLTVSYPSDLPLAVSRQLIDAGLLLPVLDGLDEIPTVRHRRDCVEAIDAYTRRTEPHRPFVLTCRAAEYSKLAPGWVGADRCVVLTGLQRGQVRMILNDRGGGHAGWDLIRVRHAAGDEVLDELFQSPLRLTIALQAYRDRDPSELLDLSVTQAKERLWELLLSSTAGTFGDATPTQVRDWLAFLATGMKRTGRQRFMLHELYLMDPDPDSTLRSFRVIVGLVFGLVLGLFLGIPLGSEIGMIGGLVFAVTVGRNVGPGRSFDVAPKTWSGLGWRARAQRVRSRDKLLVGFGAGVIAGLLGLLFGGLLGGLVYGPGLALLLGIAYMMEKGTKVVEGEPPTRFADKRPDAVLSASRNNGLVMGLCGVLVLGVGELLILLPSGSFAGLLGVLMSSLILGLRSGAGLGLGGWLYHYWLRWRLGTQGVLPRRLPEFLSWCAEPAREWLRITNAYEFRHRELLNHLARGESSRVTRLKGDRPRGTDGFSEPCRGPLA